MNSKNKTLLKDLQLYNEDGNYYLKAVYEYEEDGKKLRHTIGKISLHVNKFHIPSIMHTPEQVICNNDPCVIYDYTSVDLGFGKLPVMEYDYEGHKLLNIIETLEAEMTHEEIEKALGYKVKIKEDKYVEKSCEKCKYYETSLMEHPCVECIFGYLGGGSAEYHSKFEPKDSVEKTCQSCKHVDADWLDEPCDDCKWNTGGLGPKKDNWQPKEQK